MTDDRQLEALLRDGMAAEARPLVAESRLTERIIASATLEPAPVEPRSWQNWLVPAVAAVLVALLVGSVLFGTKLLHSAGHSPAGHHPPPTAPPFSSNPGPSVSRTPSAPTSQATPSGGNQSVAAPGTGPVPKGFTGYDLTWISPDEGWALGTAPCSQAPCTSIVHTLDGGRTWGGLPAPPAFLAESDACSSACPRVTGIRFASAQVGYVYGPNSFWSTTDGGRNWSNQAGNAWSLEVVGGRVLRVSGTDPNCAPGCRFQLQQATVGSTDWKNVALPAATQTVSATLSAGSENVVLATYGNPAGGAQGAQSVVFQSTDGGNSWHKIGEPCPQGAQENDASALAVAQDGTIAALCQPRQQAPSFLAVSPHAGSGFAEDGAIPGGRSNVLAVLNRSNAFVGGDRLYRWDGSSLHAVNGPSNVRFIGFETGSIGRALAANGLWNTSDGGLSWTHQSF